MIRILFINTVDKADAISIFFCCIFCCVTALDLTYPKQSLENFAKNDFPKELSRQARNLRRFAIGNGLLVAATVLSGAYVAGE